MTAIAPPDTRARAFVARLLRTNDPERRRALIEHHRLDPAALHDAVLALVEEANRLHGADALRMERICLDALALAGAADDSYLIAMATMRYGDALRVLGRNADALGRFDEAQAAFLRLGRPVEAARTRIGWVECAAKLGRVTDALAAARAARRVLVARAEPLRVALLDQTVGIVHFEQGNWTAALRAFTRALALYERLGDAGTLPAARMHQNRGAVFGYLGRHREALAELEIARPTFEALHEAGGLARLTSNIGANQLALGHYATAMRALEAALELTRGLRVAGREAGQILRNLCDCYLALNRPRDVLRQLDAAADELAAIDNVQDALAIATRRVVAHLRLGEQAAALAVMETALSGPAGGVNHRVWLRLQRALVLLAEGDAEAALAEARQAGTERRSTGSRRLAADCRIAVAAALLALKQLPEAKREAQRALTLARAVGAPPVLHRALELLGRIAEAEGDPAGALRRYTAAIAQLEREQRGVIFEFRDSFAAGRETAYERLAVLQVKAGKPAEALATVERGKSRALADAIRSGLELRPRGNTEARRLARELARVREEYAAVSREESVAGYRGPRPNGATAGTRAAALEAQAAALIGRLQVAGAADGIADLYAPAIEGAPPATPAGTALLEFAAGGDDLLRFFVADGAVRGDLLPGAMPQIDRLVRAFRVNLEAVERSDVRGLPSLEAQARAVLGRLFGLLFAGLEGLDGFRSLVVVPHGLLHYLPFHALHDGERFLIERLAISYAPSATLYTICRSRRRRRRGALVLAYSAGGQLPLTLGEAEAVGTVLRAAVYAEDEATRGRLEREGRRAAVIHLAAHGQFRPDAPLFSRIELADGPLTTADVFELNLNAALVTLSACETGRAVLGGGDELAGLTRAFLYAGAAALLVSQWRVEDTATAELMSRFYRELVSGAGKADALRTAQLALIAAGTPQNGRAHPFFWAGFQLLGDDRGIKPGRAQAGKES
ncbi:MAG TPA: CHAT domain-containing protein [Dehalococcoidia bacterium]|nr:CHAT domain-containing protein [Dehalococcoidia bacterium]